MCSCYLIIYFISYCTVFIFGKSNEKLINELHQQHKLTLVFSQFISNVGCMWYLQSVSTVVWPIEVTSIHDKLEDLLVGQALVRLFRQCAYLPQNNPK